MPKSQLRQQLNLSEAVEDYLKAVYQLREELGHVGEGGLVTTNALAARLGVAPGSVTGMVKKLAELRLVTHTPYRGVDLTETGERLALEIVRHHRLLELYLTQVVGFSWDEVHDQADALEHAISEEFEDRIDHLLGCPTLDPHGDPIPTKDGRLIRNELMPLVTIVPDLSRTFIIVRVMTQDSELLRYLDRCSLVPGARVRVAGREPFGGPLHVLIDPSAQTPVDTHEQHISPHVAGLVLVAPT